ncbi:unnamed protein product, partial [Brenthis ino]
MISKWRRLSVVEQIEQKELVALPSMSGDSSNQETFLKKKEDESNLIIPERSGTLPVITGAGVGAGAVTSSEISPDIENKDPEEKQTFIKHDLDENKEHAGDTNDNENKSDKDYLENNKVDVLIKSEKGKLSDNVDSVFLRSPPPHKTRSNASTTNNEEEDCGIKCLYYTLQCCDCTVM